MTLALHGPGVYTEGIVYMPAAIAGSTHQRLPRNQRRKAIEKAFLRRFSFCSLFQHDELLDSLEDEGMCDGINPVFLDRMRTVLLRKHIEVRNENTWS